MHKLTQEELTKLFQTRFYLKEGANLITGEAYIYFNDYQGVFDISLGDAIGSTFENGKNPSSPIAQELIPVLQNECTSININVGKTPKTRTWFYSQYSDTHTKLFEDRELKEVRIKAFAFIHAYYLDYYGYSELEYPEGEPLPQNSVLRYMPPREEVDIEELRQWIETAQQGSAESPEWLKSFPFTPLKKDRLEPPPYLNEAPIGNYEAVEAIDLSDLERTHQEAEEATEWQLKPIASDPKEQAAPKLVFSNGTTIEALQAYLDPSSPEYLPPLDVTLRTIQKKHEGKFDGLKQAEKTRAIKYTIECELKALNYLHEGRVSDDLVKAVKRIVEIDKCIKTKQKKTKN